MKELSIEERARRYDEAIEKAKGVIEQNPLMEYLRKGIEYIFPELKESEDEKIRKGIIRNLEYLMDRAEGFVKDELKERIAWLEKQGENNMGISEATKQKLEDNLNKALEKETPESCNEFLEKQGEQKPVDKVEPKFKVGDIIKPKDGGHEPWQIMQVDILDKKYRFKKGYVIHFSQEDAYELVEQKPDWSEEDEARFESCIKVLQTSDGYDTINTKWFKSLKERYTWKPTEEQVEALNYVVNLMASSESPKENDYYYNVFKDLKKQLKKLKE